MIKYSREKQRAKASAGKSEESIVTDIKNWVSNCEEDVSTWSDNQEKWHKLRMRIKKTKTFPFPGCANIRMPTLDTKIRKHKAATYNVLLGIRPVVSVVPAPGYSPIAALKVERFLDHLLCDVMKIQPRWQIALDRMYEKGFYLVKPYWRLETQRRVDTIKLEDIPVPVVLQLFDMNATPDMAKQWIAQHIDVDTNKMVMSDNQKAIDKAAEELLQGKKEIIVTTDDVVYNFPDFALCDPERVYVPSTSGYDPQSCEYIVHEFFMSIDQLRENALNHGWDVGNINDIEDTYRTKQSDDKNIDSIKDVREGITRLNKDNLVKVWEAYCLYDINNDGVKERCVITIAPEFSKLFRKVSLPYSSGKKPFVKLYWELTDDRWFSHRGMPEIIEDIVKEIDIQHMQKIDYGTITNSPMFLYRAGQVNPKTIQFVFGQGVPVSGMQPLGDMLAPINTHNSNVNFSYEKEQMVLESKIEEMIGQVDYTLQSMINKREPRTLGEVQFQQQAAQTVFALDTSLARIQFEEFVNWIWDLWCQYGDDEYEFAYFGQEGYMPIKLTKEELQGKYRITVRGTDQNTNPSVRLQKAQQVLMGATNPVAIQTGVVTPQNIAAAFAYFYQMLDVENWQSFVSNPQPMQPPPDVRVNAKDLTDAEMAQVLVKQGIQPDVAGRQLKEQDEHGQQTFDNVIMTSEMKLKEQETNAKIRKEMKDEGNHGEKDDK